MLEVIFMTFSIVARDVQAGELGIAVQSKFLAVGAVVPWARAGVGAIATQSWANTTYGPRGLELLASGLSASKTIEQLTRDDDRRAERQVGMGWWLHWRALHMPGQYPGRRGNCTRDGPHLRGDTGAPL